MQLRRSKIEYLEGDQIRPSNLTKARVEEYAGKVVAATSFQIGQHPSTVVEILGGRLSYQDMDDWIDENGSIFVHGQADFDILLPQYTSPKRDRFTVAHELGHYFLHALQGNVPIVAYRRGSTRIEWEANWFAAALLMPEKEFCKEYEKTSDIGYVASVFGVSEEAAKVRKEAIGV